MCRAAGQLLISHHGGMIESHLVAGNQPIPKDLNQLVYGQSITDSCVDFETTATMPRSPSLRNAAAQGND